MACSSTVKIMIAATAALNFLASSAVAASRLRALAEQEPSSPSMTMTTMSGAPAEDGQQEPRPFCVGGRVMHNTGFDFGPIDSGVNNECVVLWFQSWVLNTPALLAAGAVGVFFLGLAFELVMFARLVSECALKESGHQGVLADVANGCFYLFQTGVMYFLMLSVMTYSAPIFLAALFGVGSGHVVVASISRARAKAREEEEVKAEMESVGSVEPRMISVEA